MADELDPRDAILQAHTPAVMMPHYTNFPSLEKNGHRYLVGEDGIYLEVRRPWLHLVWPVFARGVSDGPSLPYGPVLDDEMDFAFDQDGPEFKALIERFAVEARAAMPNEYAAWLVWDANAESLVYTPLLTIDAGPGGIKFHRPALRDHEHLAVDLHSHGTMSAFFSSTDDADDAGEVKLAGVLGNVDTADEELQLRLCAHGLFIAFGDQPDELDGD